MTHWMFLQLHMKSAAKYKGITKRQSEGGSMANAHQPMSVSVPCRPNTRLG